MFVEEGDAALNLRDNVGGQLLTEPSSKQQVVPTLITLMTTEVVGQEQKQL